jgi:GAF domain-containing protein
VSPSLPSDATLTALASIGPLRLNCDRSFVSLIDSHNQYIIAEGTRTLSSRQPGRHGGEDGLYLGVQALDKVWGVCPNTIHAFTDTTGKSKVNTLNVVADTSKYYIRDFQADPTFVHRPFVTSWPHMRSYLEVPLRSPSGFVIGSYCVVDNKVREDFDDDAVFILDEVATSIMEHLDLVKARIFCDRAGRLMKGLGVFIQKDSADQSDARVQDSLLAKGSSRKGSAGSYLEASTTRTTTGSNDERCKAGQTPPSTPSPGTEKNPFVTATLEPRVGTTEEAPAVHSVSEADASTTENAKMQPDISTEVARTFSRAGVLIRDALDVEGVVFIDAYSAGIGAEGGSSQFGVSSAKEFDFLRSDTSLSAHSRTAEPLCTMLSSSTKHSVDVAQHMLERGVPESLLRRLMAEYPSGQVFTDEAMGTFLGNGNHSNQYLGAAQSADARKLFDLFPQAKCLMFLPLWDFNKNRFFAATFTFSNDPTRFFNMDDVTYLSAFGNSIMTEISRIEAVATSNAKSDFISSIRYVTGSAALYCSY